MTANLRSNDDAARDVYAPPRDSRQSPRSADINRLRERLARVEAQLARERRARRRTTVIARKALEMVARCDTLLGVASHDTRTPLNVIMGWAKVLVGAPAGRPLEDEPVARGLETIERNAVAQAMLLEDFAEAGRVLRGALEPEIERERVDLVGCVQSAATARRVVVALDAEDGACVVDGDPGRLTNALGKLIVCARGPSREGRVRVAVARRQGFVEVTVARSDVAPAERGWGAPVPTLVQALDTLRRSDTRARGADVVGLGVARAILEAHGGAVSSLVGDGGFVVRLPSA